MSETDNSRQDNILPDPDLTDADATDETLVTPAIDASGPFAQEMPLPEFNTTSPQAEEESEISGKSSDATPQKLTDLFTPAPQSQEPGFEKTIPKPVYRVSSAEPDLANNYPVPSVDNETTSDTEEGPSGWQTTWSIIREVGETIILTLIIFFLIQLFVRNFRVVGTSMISNLHDGQYLIIDKVTYNPYLHEYLGIGGPQRGDVIVFKPPRNPEDDYVKRVIGLSGEKVQIINGQVLINDELMEEPFQPTTGSYSMSNPVIVPEGQIFVLGDNRNNSNDSHNWGPLPIENIVGRAWISYWPPDQWGIIPRDAPTSEATVWYFIDQVIPTANAHNE